MIQVDGVNIEKETAFPNLTGEQTALMLRWTGEKWELFGWGAYQEHSFNEKGEMVEGREFCAWEQLSDGNRRRIQRETKELMRRIQKG